MTGKGNSRGIFYALTAAALYSLNAPCSKLLLSELPPMLTAAFLYTGAGVGMLLVGIVGRLCGRASKEAKLTVSDLPYTAAMVILDIAAPIFLMLGLKTASAANVSLLNNFETVATAVIALCFFGEKISRRLWLAIGLVTAACVLLTFDGSESFSFTPGSAFVIAACVCWGLENNCTRRLSGKDPLETVVVKGFGSGTGALIVALIAGERLSATVSIPLAMLLGFIAYGMSIYFYIRAQRLLGAAKTGTYYAVAPFIGVALSLIIFRQLPGISLLLALPLMAVGTRLASSDGNSS